MKKIVGCLMVKNEIPYVDKTIESCKDIVDILVVLDTGSNDGTPHHIYMLCETLSIPVIVYEEPFVNYSVSRNKLLDLARDEGDYFLFLDSNDEIKGATELKKYILEQDEFDVLIMKHILDNNRRKGTREIITKVFLVNTKRKDIRYRYPIHEELIIKNPGKIVDIKDENIYMYQDRLKDKPSEPRFEKDLEILLGSLQHEPKNIRTLYYTAQTLCCMNKYEESLFFTHQIMMLIDYEEKLKDKHLWACLTHISNSLIVLKEHLQDKAMKEYLHEGFRRLFYYARNTRMEPFLLYGQFALLYERYDIAYIYISISCRYARPKGEERYFEDMYQDRMKYYSYARDKLTQMQIDEIEKLDIEKMKNLPLMNVNPIDIKIEDINVN